jgi:hypothetical protein
MTIRLGDVYRDTITGFTGVATSRHEYLNGCVRIGLQPRALHEGKPIDSQTFDVEQLEATKEPGVAAVQRPTGGPREAPPTRAVPSRP